jgi:hypothetical protein
VAGKNLQKSLKRAELRRKVVQNSRIGPAQKAVASGLGALATWCC